MANNNNSVIRDNYFNGTVGEFLQNSISNNSEVSIVSAYFTIYAYFYLKDQLNSINKLRFLFGEPTFIKNIDPDKSNQKGFLFDNESYTIKLESELMQKSIAKECSEWINDKVEIRSMLEPVFLHGKMYHIKESTGIQNALVGSSNFTAKGMGLSKSKNIELNLIIDSDRDRKALLEWFNSLWDNEDLVLDVKEEVLKYLAQLYQENSPEFIYYKTLFHIFEDYITEQQKGGLLNEKTGFFDSEIWNKLYDFQKDGVKGAINKILKHNGCIIADSVGLGKTYEALAIIKYFELLNANVLVVCPKKLEKNWTLYQASKNNINNPFTSDRFGYSVIYHTDMGRTSGISQADNINLETFNWAAYDLIVIDESHNFRGNPMENIRNGEIRLNRAKWLMEKVIKSGSKTKVLMLSATPVNNTLRDLRNQIAFITEGEEDALFESCGIKDISMTLKNAQTQFTNWTKNKEKNIKNLLEELDSSFFKLLNELTIARSRKHITSSYNINQIGKFPDREKPFSVYPMIDTSKRFPSYDIINEQILKYKLSIFNPSFYVLDEKKEKYKKLADEKVLNFNQEQRENFLIGMMKVNFLKRLESSIESFEISLERTIEKIEILLDKIDSYEANKTNIKDDTLFDSIPDEVELAEDNEDIEQWEIGKKLKFNLSDLNLKNWKSDLENDKTALYQIYTIAKDVTPEKDGKLIELKKLIKEKVNNTFNENNKKIIIFTAFADTAVYLYNNLENYVKNEFKLNIALVTGTNTKTTFGQNDYDSILTNFSPISKNRTNNDKENSQIDVLIATDCISEGQNLQDCDYLINYDIHWNPVRIIQRFGRIDRLGSKNKTIKMINFWPTNDLDKYIKLKVRVEARMALVDITATGDDNILNIEEQEQLITDELNFRNDQLLKLKDEILDLEEMNENISLTDFTLDDFKIDLMNFINQNRNILVNAPLGLYAVVPAAGGIFSNLFKDKEFSVNEKNIITPGIIFCLAQKEKFDNIERINPLNPYYLVYIRNDGTVRYNYTNSKQILEIFRLLCQGRVEPFNTLCDSFNKETENGKNMEKQNNLLKKAVEEIVRIFRNRDLRQLLMNRDAVIAGINQQVKTIKDFKLITWLILR